MINLTFSNRKSRGKKIPRIGEKSQDEWDNQKILKVSRKEQKQPPPKKAVHTEMLLWMA